MIKQKFNSISSHSVHYTNNVEDFRKHDRCKGFTAVKSTSQIPDLLRLTHVPPGETDNKQIKCNCISKIVECYDKMYSGIKRTSLREDFFRSICFYSLAFPDFDLRLLVDTEKLQVLYTSKCGILQHRPSIGPSFLMKNLLSRYKFWSSFLRVVLGLQKN